MEKPILKRENILYPELSYSIVGCAFEIFNQLGPGHAEKIYHNALALSFKDKGLPYKDQISFAVMFKDKVVGKNILDFLVDERIIVEIKKDVRYSKIHLEQVLNYLKVTSLKLALLITFTNNGVTFKRIINISEST